MPKNALAQERKFIRKVIIMKKIISILMIALMMLTSGVLTAFAENGTAINPPATVQAHHGYGSVYVYWSQVPEAQYYQVFKAADAGAAVNGAPVATVYSNNTAQVRKAPWDKNQNAFFWKDANSGAQTFYAVYAVAADGTRSAAAVSNGASRVEYIKYKFTLKSTKTLKSHDGKRKRYTFRKGTELTSSGFGGGKYKFYYNIGGKNYYFYCNAIATKNCSAVYDRELMYSTTSAENYVNDKGFKSKTNYLIWTSLYTQHTYIFKGSKGHWNCIRDFEVGSGTARAASPSGEDKYLISGRGTERSPGKKYARSGHGRRYYWSPYSSWNSYHSVKLAKDGSPLQTLGFPASKGCIRCTLDDAKFVFGLPRGTRVVVL